MLELQQTSSGVLLPVRAHPQARSNCVTGIHAGRLKLSVTVPAEKGKANRALVRLLSKSLKLRTSQIALHSGETSTVKQFLINDINPGELKRRIASVLGLE